MNNRKLKGRLCETSYGSPPAHTGINTTIHFFRARHTETPVCTHTRQKLFSRAVADFMSPPVVKSIDTSAYHGVAGSTIRIRATDDFRVTGVRVEIFATSGTLLEKGNAVQQTNGIDWIYTTSQANAVLAGSKINAIATDVPGNTGTRAVTL